MKFQITLKSHKHAVALVLAFVLQPVLMAARTGAKVVKAVVKMVALRHAAVDVGKDVVDPVEMDAPHHVTMFAEMIAFLLVQELAELDVRATVSSDAAATAMVTVLAHVKADVVMVALVVLFKYLALVFIFDVTH